MGNPPAYSLPSALPPLSSLSFTIIKFDATGNLGCMTHGATIVYPSMAFDAEATLKVRESHIKL